MWQIDLVGEAMDIAEVEKLAQACDCRIVTGDDGRPCLTGSRFNAISDAERVRKEAAHVLRVLNGLARLEHSNHSPVRASGAVSRRDRDGRRHVNFELESVQLRMRASQMRMTVTRANGAIEVSAASSWPIERATRVAADPRLAEIVSLLCGDVSWQRLRVAFEKFSALIGGGDNGLVKHGYAEQSEISRFKANIEDPRLSGDDAVHGVPKWGGPPKGSKMEVHDGLVFVTRLVDEHVRRLP